MRGSTQTSRLALHAESTAVNIGTPKKIGEAYLCVWVRNNQNPKHQDSQSPT